jgi:CheY-like chemotaxis protein
MRGLRARGADFRTIGMSCRGAAGYWNERMDELIDVIEGTQDDTAWAELVHPDTTDVAPAPAKRPVERHGGRAAAPASTQAGHAPHGKAGPAIRRVLVVDDNADAAQTVAMLLEVLGHETAVEDDPLQALASARERSFDAFVLDIGLPGMDGHELARQIRTLPQAAGALFIALTGYGQQQDRDASAAAGFHYHFVKPADVDALARALAGGVPE